MNGFYQDVTESIQYSVMFVREKGSFIHNVCVFITAGPITNAKDYKDYRKAGPTTV